MCNDTEEHCKFEEYLTCRFKIDLINPQKFAL